MKYKTRSEAETAYRRMLATFKRKKKQVHITLAEYEILWNQLCCECLGSTHAGGPGFKLIKPRGPIALGNVLPICNVCRYADQAEDFDPIKFACNSLRRFWKKTPMAVRAMARAKKGYGKYECAGCKDLFGPKQIQLDHIEPVIGIEEGYVDLTTFALRLYCSDDNLQVLCKACHTVKTNEENQLRREFKKKN